MKDLRKNSPGIADVLNHPSLPLVHSGTELGLAYLLCSLSMEEFLTNAAQVKTRKELDDSLTRANRTSALYYFFSRRNDIIFFSLSNSVSEAQLQIDATGSIYYGANSDKLPASLILYLLFRLITDDTCPWSLESIKKDWKKNATIAKSLFNYQNQPAPITLNGLIWKNTHYSIDQLVILENLKDNLGYFEKLEHFHLPLINSNERATLLPSNGDQDDLFYFLKHGSTYKSFWWDRQQEHRQLPVWDLVQFVFSDNSVLSIKDIQHHPYAIFLPQRLIPKLSSTKTQLNYYEISPVESEKRTEQTIEIINIQKSILHNFINSKDFQNSTTKIYFTPGAQEGLPYVKIHQIDLLPSNYYRWKLEAGLVKGKLTSDSFFSQDGKTLTLNSFSSQREAFKKLAARFDFNIISDSTNEIIATFGPNIDAHHFKIQFNQSISKNFNTQLNLEDVPQVPDENVSVNVFLSPNELGKYHSAFNIEVKLPEDSSVFNLSKMPDLLYRCLNGINAGLGQFFYEEDSKRLAVQKQGDKRKNDLKLLRHSGIFKLLLAEIIRFLNTPSDHREKLKDFEKKLIQKSQQILLNSSSDDQISSRVKSLIREFCQSICMESSLENYLFSDGQKIFQVNLKIPILKLLESVLEWINYGHGESALTKTQIKELAYYNNHSPAFGALLSPKKENPHQLSLYDAGEISEGILALMGSNLYHVYISGQKVESLNEGSFTTSIAIGENQGKINWFDLHPQIFFNGKEISYEQLQTMKERDVLFFEGTPYHVNFNKMPKLKFLDRFWAKLKYQKNTKRSWQANDAAIFRQERALLLEVLSMRKAGVEIKTSPEWVKICSDFDSLMENKVDDLDRADFKVPLKDYQRIGTQWLLNLYKIGLGGILADDMGLGKTIQAIGFLDILRLQGNTNFHLIIVPTSLIYNWTAEISRFAPLLKVDVFESRLKKEYERRWQQSPPKVVIITYGLLFENNDFLNQFHWSSAIFDEAQSLKNISSQRSIAARFLNSKTTICITGTPMENHYGEFYSLIDLCVPGALGDYRDFVRSFSIEGFSVANPSAKRQALSDEVKFLRMKTSPLVLRRLKTDLLHQLPEKAESSILIPFEKQQKEIYRNIAISWNDKIKSVIEEDSQSNTQLQMLTALLRLRQICSFPAMVEKIKYNKTPPKFELLFESISEIYEKGESVLVFTNFLATLEEIEKHFRASGYKTQSIHGGMSAKRRQSELKSFQEHKEASILIMTLKTGGVGLNLTKASYVFHIEPWWNPASENQATDRAHRIGQTKSVQVYRYLMKDSVEEKIQQLKSLKGQAFDALFKEESEAGLVGHKAFSGQLSYKDFQYLLD